MFLTVAFSGPAADAGKVPFNGTLAANEDFRLLGDPPFGFFVDGSGTATSTQLGQFTLVYTFMVAFSDINPATSPGRARLIAANGDNIFTTSDGSDHSYGRSQCLKHCGNAHHYGRDGPVCWR